MLKKKCLYGKYYENFSDFSSAIYECLNDAHLKHKKELDSLLTLRFQKFNIAIPIVVRYRVLGFEESGVRIRDSGFRIQELRFWCTA